MSEVPGRFGNDPEIWLCRHQGDYFPHPVCPFDCDCKPARYIQASADGQVMVNREDLARIMAWITDGPEQFMSEGCGAAYDRLRAALSDGRKK